MVRKSRYVRRKYRPVVEFITYFDLYLDVQRLSIFSSLVRVWYYSAANIFKSIFLFKNILKDLF
jgi:hypothetical protein